MLKSFFIYLLFCHVIFIEGLSQYSYHPPSTDKESWQRLNLSLSSIFFRTVKQSNIDWDSSLLFVSRSLGLSRLPVTAEGIDDTELFAQSKWYDQGDPHSGIKLLSQATGKKHLQLLLLLGSYYAFQSDSYHHYRDSVEYFLNKAITESKAINEKKLGHVALCLLGKMYVQASDTVNGNSVFNKVINESNAEGDKRTEARAFAYRAIYAAPSPVNLQERLDYIQKATQIYHDIKDPESEIPLIHYTGFLFIRMARFNDAYDCFVKALQLENSIGYPYTHYSTDAIVMITTVQNKFGEPLRYALESVRNSESVRDSVGWPFFYTRLGSLYIIEGQDEEATKWMMKAVDRFAKINDADVYVTLFSLVSSLIERGREQEGLDLILRLSKKIFPKYNMTRIYYNMALGVAYRGVRQYKLAEQYVTTADSIINLPETPAVMKAYLGLNINFLYGTIYFKSGQLSKSKKYFEEYLSGSSRPANIKTDMSAYECLIHIDSVFHDDVSAVKHYKEYIQLLDSNFTVSQIRQAEELNVTYQTKEKQDSITLLSQQAKFEQANLKQANLAKNLTVAGIIAVLIIAGLLYRQSRLRKKNNNLITHNNEQLQHLVAEKEWLLKEIHHRVKNNLQIVMSLLNSQSAYIDNETALTAIHDSQHRVQAMSLIHQKLYSAESVSSIEVSFYIRELVSYLTDSFNVGQRIRFELAIDPVEMDVSQAVPLGLILNEAITNSIKHAFPGGRDGVIAISLLNTSAYHYLLCISDNGIGIPANYNKRTSSLGMSLMKGLSEDLDGNFSIENHNGTTIKITFMNDLAVHRPDIPESSFASNN
jgi:two-component sensor histidine kinase